MSQSFISHAECYNADWLYSECHAEYHYADWHGANQGTIDKWVQLAAGSLGLVKILGGLIKYSYKGENYF